ncbi:carbamate kinase [Chitinimonas koreensis]|uniref:carbamate kinase n=1 Tax=Chitinimonas koreensis TaxID=356302 RepID=UPI000406E64C|nr:carbamate kinase [Chitinimonas koreensis]QNM97884.1 carbamate kinase [Chitinimonas koreensis]
MKVVVALGGNALLRRGQVLSAQNQVENIRRVAAQLARVAAQHTLVLTHGNGPQVGLLALQSAAAAPLPAYPMDVLGAESEGMIGYLLEQELTNALPAGRAVATLLTRVEVDPDDPAFAEPTKPIGPVYAREEAERVSAGCGWRFAPDGAGLRRVVASPRPRRILGLDPIRWLLERGAIVIAAGGGGIPVARGADGAGLHGVEAVIDKDLCSALLAQALGADCLVIATDVDAVYLDWKRPGQRPLAAATPRRLAACAFAAGSMGPKVQAAVQFVEAGGRRAAIGSLDQVEALLAGTAGTQITADQPAGDTADAEGAEGGQG